LSFQRAFENVTTGAIGCTNRKKDVVLNSVVLFEGPVALVCGHQGMIMNFAEFVVLEPTPITVRLAELHILYAQLGEI